jgi:hypothetical protein
MKFVFRNIEDIVLFHNQGALVYGMSIGHEFCTSDLAIAAYSNGNSIRHIVEASCVAVKSFSGLELGDIFTLVSKCKGLGPGDCSVLFYAMLTGATIISAEKIIINTCQTLNIKTVLPELYLQKIKQYEKK